MQPVATGEKELLESFTLAVRARNGATIIAGWAVVAAAGHPVVTFRAVLRFGRGGVAVGGGISMSAAGTEYIHKSLMIQLLALRLAHLRIVGALTSNAARFR